MSVVVPSRNDRVIALQEGLSQFTGSERRFPHWGRRLWFTEGIRYLADKAGAYWLIDVVANYQIKACITRMEGFQLWELTVRPDKTATIVCRADTGIKPAITQEIECTTFPLREFSFYVEGNVMLLKSEH